jgi:hypothetical protein
MGAETNIGFDQFPKQGIFLGCRTRVCFHYESRELMGTIIRDDIEKPFKTIIRLDDGRVVLATECMYAPDSLNASAEAPEEWPDVIQANQ